MITRINLCKGEVRTIEDVVEAWKEAHHEAMRVRYIEDLIPRCVAVKDNFRAWHEELWDCAFSGELTSPHHEGETLMKWLEKAIPVLVGVEPWIAWALEKGYGVDGAEDYRGAVEEVKRMKGDFSKSWPFFDPEQVSEARAEIARGEYQTAEEILSELQGTHPQ